MTSLRQSISSNAAPRSPRRAAVLGKQHQDRAISHTWAVSSRFATSRTFSTSCDRRDDGMLSKAYREGPMTTVERSRLVMSGGMQPPQERAHPDDHSLHRGPTLRGSTVLQIAVNIRHRESRNPGAVCSLSQPSHKPLASPSGDPALFGPQVHECRPSIEGSLRGVDAEIVPPLSRACDLAATDRERTAGINQPGLRGQFATNSYQLVHDHIADGIGAARVASIDQHPLVSRNSARCAAAEGKPGTAEARNVILPRAAGVSRVG